MAKSEITLNEFDGGLNTKSSPLNLESNESPDSQNVVYDDTGAIETRTGYEMVTTLPVGHKVDLLKSFNPNGKEQQLIAISDGSAWVINTTTNTYSLISRTAHTMFQGNPIVAVNAKNRLFISDGRTDPMKYDGTYWTRWGVPAPTSACVAIATTKTGVLSGTYTYVCMGKNTALATGNYGPKSNDVIASSTMNSLSDIPTYPYTAGVGKIVIARNTAAALDTYYIIGEVDNGITVFEDNVADEDLDAGDLAPLDNGVPKHFKTIVYHWGRMFGAGIDSLDDTSPTSLYYTEASEPEIFPDSNLIKVGDGDGLPITGLAVLANSILITKADSYGVGSVYLLYMPSNHAVDWSLTKLNTDNSSQSAKAMIHFANWIMLINATGIYDINEDSVGEIKTDAISYKIEPEMLSLAASSISNAVAVNYKNKIWVSAPSR